MNNWTTILVAGGGMLLGMFTNPRFIDLVLQALEYTQPWVIVKSWEQGLILRWGAGKLTSPGGHPYQRVIGPGFHWKLPFADSAMTLAVVTESMTYLPQAFVSCDGTAFLCQFHALYRIDDIVVHSIDVYNTDATMVDAVAGTLRKIIKTMSNEEITSENLEQRLTERARSRAKRFGVYMERVYVSEMVPLGLRQGAVRLATSGGATL